MLHPIDHLLQQPEGKTLEFKRDLSSPRNVLKTLVAFANAAGGCLVIGVDDSRQVLGVSDPLDEEARICNRIADGISPRLVPSVELASVGDRTLLIVEVFPSSARPHYINSLGPEAGVYVRLGASNRQAGPDWITETRRAAAGQVFDEQPMPELGIDDLDVAAMARVFGPTRTLDERSLQTLKLLRAEQGLLVPTRGAVLLFGKARGQHFPDAWIQCGRFRGLDKADIFDQHEVHAHLPDAVAEIELFLKKHAFKTARFGAMRREDVWSIPLTMLREAIINALVHSDYAQRGTPIRVAFFDDRIDIESPGLLLPGMTIDDMKSGVSRIRNPVIARVFRELGLIEQWGSGIRRIFDEATRQGLPAPVIEEIATGVRLCIRLAQQHAPELPPSNTRQESDDDRASLSRLESQLESRLESKLAAKIVLQLGTQPSGKAELARALGHTTVSGELHKQIRRLLDLSLIEMTIPDKPQSRLQRYRLTQTGRQLFDPIEGKTT